MESLLPKLAEHGLVALLLTLSLYALYKLFIRYEAVHEARHADAAEHAKSLAAAWDIVKALKDERLELLTLLRSAIDAQSRRGRR